MILTGPLGNIRNNIELKLTKLSSISKVTRFQFINESN